MFIKGKCLWKENVNHPIFVSRLLLRKGVPTPVFNVISDLDIAIFNTILVKITNLLFVVLFMIINITLKRGEAAVWWRRVKEPSRKTLGGTLSPGWISKFWNDWLLKMWQLAFTRILEWLALENVETCLCYVDQNIYRRVHCQHQVVPS